jgi:hypothetical protein
MPGSVPASAPPRRVAPAEAAVAAQALPADPSVATVRIGITRNGVVDDVAADTMSRVLAGEALPGSPPAAMEALVSRFTYTIAKLIVTDRQATTCVTRRTGVMRTH